jgi:hypothetical protein
LKVIQSISKRVIETPEDRTVFNYFQSKFRIVSEDEPYILDFKATLLCSTTDTGAAVTTKGTIGNNNRSGIAYITDCNIFFTSHEIFLLPMMQKVIPLSVIREVTVLKATMVASDGVCVMDDGGESSVFYVSHPAPNYADRICDMLNVLIMLKKAREAEAEAGNAAAGELHAVPTSAPYEVSNGQSAMGGGRGGRGKDGSASTADCNQEQSGSDDTLRRVRTMAIAAVKSVNDVGTDYMGSVNAGVITSNGGKSDDDHKAAEIIPDLLPVPPSTASQSQSDSNPPAVPSGATAGGLPPGKSPLARGIQVSLRVLADIVLCHSLDGKLTPGVSQQAYLEKLQKNP